MAGLLFIISAPSGSGKSTLVSELRKQVIGIEFAVSWTTRAPRGSEEDGREYNFTTREKFQRMIDDGVFLEHAEVFATSTVPLASPWKRRAPTATTCSSTSMCRAQRKSAPIPRSVSIFVMPPTPRFSAPACAIAAAPKAL